MIMTLRVSSRRHPRDPLEAPVKMALIRKTQFESQLADRTSFLQPLPPLFDPQLKQPLVWGHPHGPPERTNHIRLRQSRQSRQLVQAHIPVKILSQVLLDCANLPWLLSRRLPHLRSRMPDKQLAELRQYL